MNAAVCGKHNWISNLLEKKKNKNAAPWFIRPMSQVQHQRSTVKWNEESPVGWRNRRGRNPTETTEQMKTTGTDGELTTEEGCVHVQVGHRGSWSSYGMILQGEPLPPASEASLERMIHASPTFAPFQKRKHILLQHRLGQLAKSKKKKR